MNFCLGLGRKSPTSLIETRNFSFMDSILSSGCFIDLPADFKFDFKIGLIENLLNYFIKLMFM